MTERDEEGRPVPTKNAGAFLGPFSGVVPVPSSAATDEGSIEPAISLRMRWLLGGGNAIAVWALGFSVLQLLLSGTADWAGRTGGTSGERLLTLIHTPGFLLLAHLVLFVLATWVGLRSLPSVENRDRLRMAAVTLLGAAAVAGAVLLFGDLAAAVATVVALVWLGAANRVQHA